MDTMNVRKLLHERRTSFYSGKLTQERNPMDAVNAENFSHGNHNSSYTRGFIQERKV